MHKISFLKINGAGNDFILFDFREVAGVDLPPEAIRKLCHRNFGIGADGVLVIENGKNETDFSLRYYNADGYPGSLCGNGSRCAVVYAGSVLKKLNTSLTFDCDDKLYSGTAFNSQSGVVCLSEIRNTMKTGNIEFQGKQYSYSYLNTGSPHAVINFAENEKEERFFSFDICSIGNYIRNREDIFPGGTNVNFYIFRNGELFLRTYERGVENETLACGTGSVAVAMVVSGKMRIQPPIPVKTRGGAVLTVRFVKTEEVFSSVELEGPVQISFTGNVLI